MSTKEEPLQTLDLAALSTVTGGTTTSDQDLLTALSSIVTSLQGLGTQQSSNSFNPQTMMMMMMMMENRNQATPVVASPYYPTAPTGGWYY